MKYFSNADNHVYACFIVLENGFSLANLSDITTYAAGASYSCYWDGLGAYYCYLSGIFTILHCIMAVSCICALLRAILLRKHNNFKNRSIE